MAPSATPARGRRASLALVAAALFAPTLAFMLWYRNEGIFHLDAVFLAEAVEDVWNGRGWDVRWRFGAVLANAGVYGPFWLAGESAERATVVASCLFHALSVPMAFLFVTRLSGSRRHGALAAGLLAVAPACTISNSFGKEYGLAMLLVAAALWLAVVAHDTGSAWRAALGAFLWAFAYTVWEGLLAATPLLAVALLMPRASRPRLPAAPRRRRLLAGAGAGWTAGLAVAVSTSLLAMLRTYAAERQMTAVAVDPAAMLWRAGADLVRFSGWTQVLAAATGVALAWRRRQARRVLPLGVLLVATILFYGSLSTYGPRYLSLAALGLAILAGAAFEWLLTQRPAVRATGLLAYGLTIAAMLAAALPLLEPRRTYNGAKRYALFVAEATEPDSLIVVTDDSRFIEYYARRATRGHPIGDADATAAWVRALAEEARQRPVYLTESGLAYDPGRIVQRALDDTFTRQLIGTRSTEDYHHAEGRRRVYEGHLWRLVPR